LCDPWIVVPPSKGIQGLGSFSTRPLEDKVGQAPGYHPPRHSSS